MPAVGSTASPSRSRSSLPGAWSGRVPGALNNTYNRGLDLQRRPSACGGRAGGGACVTRRRLQTPAPPRRRPRIVPQRGRGPARLPPPSALPSARRGGGYIGNARVLAAVFGAGNPVPARPCTSARTCRKREHHCSSRSAAARRRRRRHRRRRTAAAAAARSEQAPDLDLDGDDAACAHDARRAPCGGVPDGARAEAEKVVPAVACTPPSSTFKTMGVSVALAAPAEAVTSAATTPTGVGSELGTRASPITTPPSSMDVASFSLQL